MPRAGLVALAIVLVSSSAFADEPKTVREQVKLIYRVPSDCPDESAFLGVVTARTQRANFVDHDGASRRFIVDIWRRGNGYGGRLVIEEPSATEGTVRPAARELAATRCADLVRALALFTAIAIDPGTEERAPPRSEATTPRSEGTLRVPPPRSPPSAPTATPVNASPPKWAEPKRTEPKQGRVWRVAAGSGVFVAGGIAQSMMASAHPVAEVASTGPLFSPSLRAGLVWANSAADPVGTAELALGLRMLVLSACAVRVPVARVMGLRLCVALEGGVLVFHPSGVERPRSPVNPWFAADPLARLDLPLLPRLLALEVEAGVAVPFTRLRGFVDPGPILAEVGTVGVRFGAAFLLQAF